MHIDIKHLAQIFRTVADVLEQIGLGGTEAPPVPPANDQSPSKATEAATAKK